jgi:hypothetical protein
MILVAAYQELLRLERVREIIENLVTIATRSAIVLRKSGDELNSALATIVATCCCHRH